MSITYTWKICSLQKINSSNLPNAIIGINWELKGVDEAGNEGVFQGATPFSVDKINPNNFIDYSNLTEEVVLNWVKNAVMSSSWDHVSKNIINQIDNIKNQYAQVHKMPWEPADEPVQEKPLPPANTGQENTGNTSA